MVVDALQEVRAFAFLLGAYHKRVVDETDLQRLRRLHLVGDGKVAEDLYHLQFLNRGAGTPAEVTLAGCTVLVQIVHIHGVCGINLRLACHVLKDLFVRLTHVQVMRGKDLVEVPIEVILLVYRIPVHLVGVRQQYRSVACLAQRGYIVESVLRQFVQHAQPCLAHIVSSRAGIAVLNQRLQKSIGRDVSVLIVVHQLQCSGTHGCHALALIVDAENVSHIVFAHQALEVSHAARHIQIDYHTAQVKDDGCERLIHYD